MILVVDVGNTNITYGVYDGENLAATFRMMSSDPKTSDEYGMMITSLIKANGVETSNIKGAIIASVVPNIMHSLTRAIQKYLHIIPMEVGPGTKTGIKIASDNPKEMGADRIVDVVAAFEKFGGPTLVIDFGTATTYDLVTADGTFRVGITAPGIKISAKALWTDTAKLPEIEIKKPSSILATETISSMQAGLVYGQIGQTEYIIREVKKESNLPNLKVVATGGLGRLIADETESIDVYDPSLTLEGLRIIYMKNSKKL